MAHQLLTKDTMFSVREMPWHGLGTVLPDYPKSIDEALQLSGLGWQVKQGSVMVAQDAGDPFEALTVADRIAACYEQGEPIHKADLEEYLAVRQAAPHVAVAPDYRANLRADDGAVLGIVSEDYKVVQNREAFEFLDALIGSDVTFETAGSLLNGKKVWVLARIPDFVEVGGDETATFIYVANAHDGSMAVTASATKVRIVCANTLGWALRQSDTGTAAMRTYKFRHTGDLAAKFEEARRVMGITIKWAERFKALGDQLATVPMTKPTFENKVVVELVPIDRDVMGQRAITNRENAREKMINLFNGTDAENGDTRGNSPGTKWCAVNAVSEFYDWHRRYTAKTDQMFRSFEDQDLKQRALDLIVAA